MKFVKYIFVFVFCLCATAFVLFAPKTLYTLKHPFNLFTNDNLSNLYLINGEEIIKYSPTGKQLLKYSNKRFGNITTIDATNALKILLYYKDFQQLVFLDNQL